MTVTNRLPLFVQLLLAGALLCCVCRPAVADGIVCPLIAVDENGKGTVDLSVCVGGGSSFTLPSVLAADPGPGGLSSVLTYDLLAPPSLVAGDVFLQDGVGGPVLDVIRFNPAGTGGNSKYPASLLFYSDKVDGFDSLADTSSMPGQFYTNTVTIPEVGPEGNNGAIYTPTANQPGFIAGFNVRYDLISDAVPEPRGLGLLGIGLICVAGVIRRRFKKATLFA